MKFFLKKIIVVERQNHTRCMETLAVSGQCGLPDKGWNSKNFLPRNLNQMADSQRTVTWKLKIRSIQSLVTLGRNQSVQKFVKWVQVENEIKLIINSISFRCHVATRCQMPSNLHINYIACITLHNSVESQFWAKFLNGKFKIWNKIFFILFWFPFSFSLWAKTKVKEFTYDL